jgi:Putative adhesin
MLAYALTALLGLAQTDQTVQVQKGTRLDINNFSGEVTIKVWDRDAVRVEVDHSDRDTVDIRTINQRLTIRGRGRNGRPRSLDYTVSVPRWMPISVSGPYTDVTMDGVGADVSVDTMGGDVSVKGGAGFVSLKSVQGHITLDGAKGRIELNGVNDDIRLVNVSGDISAETTNGAIMLDKVDATNLDAYTINGDISYDGPIRDKGAYRLTTHNGTIGLAIAERINATLTVRTYSGGFRSSFPVKADDQNNRRRFTLTFGNGSAHVEIESFSGSIVLRRPGEALPAAERGRGRARQRD